MTTIPLDETECQQDALQRLNRWINALEERICVLLGTNDVDTMKPGEREQAATRHLMLMLRLLQLRQQYAEPKPSPGEQALLDALLRGMDDE